MEKTGRWKRPEDGKDRKMESLETVNNYKPLVYQLLLSKWKKLEPQAYNSVFSSFGHSEFPD